MKPISFPQQNVIFGKDQKDYHPLPAAKTDDGTVVTCWELDQDEIDVLAKTKKMYFLILTFNEPLQPILPCIENPFIEE